MAITNVALKAYQNVAQTQQAFERKVDARMGLDKPRHESFSKTMEDSIDKVNDLQSEKAGMIEAFASGEKQNVHELMISLQKASLAMNMTGAVRTKLMQAYQEVMKMPF